MEKRFQERYENIDDHVPHGMLMKFWRFCYAIKFHYRISGECERKRRKKILKLPLRLYVLSMLMHIIYFFLTSALSIMYIYRSCNIFNIIISISVFFA